MALVELVKEDRRDAFECRIVLHESGEDPLGDDLDASLGRDPRLVAHAVPDGPADFLAEEARHLLSRSAGGDAPRFEHEDPSVPAPRGCEQVERNARRLPGPRWRHQYGHPDIVERDAKGRQCFVDGERGSVQHQGQAYGA